MIKSFAHKGLEVLYLTGSARGVNPQFAAKLERMLDRLNASESVNDMDAPGFALHPLKGNMKGMWAVKVSGNWRLVFRFNGCDAYDVNLLDYH